MDNSETNQNEIDLKIPRERVGVLIGKEGEIRKQIEENGEISLLIDSREGDVRIIQRGDPLKANISAEVVKAIGRGFNPEKAMFLFDENYQLIVMTLREYARKGSRRIGEIKGRIIGREGKTRKVIEDLTGTSVSIYGDTVSVIGDYISIKYSLEAIKMIIEGRKQRTVYNFLEGNVKKMKMEKLEEAFR
ncbi:MAG: KH domain-containing protein [Candidatus Thermoplasmatota archaeon]|nr:KH domain-containing protein [Candidatus Thermoplasmatota archaeon]